MPAPSETVARALFAAFGAHELDQARTLLRDDAVLIVGGTDTRFEGAAAFLAAAGQTLALLPDLEVTVTDAFASGERVAAEVVRTGTHTGDVPLPDGRVSPATGDRVRLAEAALLRVTGGTITEMIVYADQLSTYRQLGLLPSDTSDS